MALFKDFPATDVAGIRYSERVRVYVESKEDLELLRDKWFADQLDAIDFMAVDQPEGGGGGCQVVINKVQRDRELQGIAYGIVDRDSLLTDGRLFPLLIETNHDDFLAQRPFGDFIHVLKRWEMENYLLQPHAIEAFLRDSPSAQTKRFKKHQDFAQNMLEFVEFIVLISAANILLVQKNQATISGLFAKSEENLSKFRMMLLESDKIKDNITEEDMKGMEQCIRNFQIDSSLSAENQWDHINHLIEGKAFLKRFFEWIGLKDEVRLHLARCIKELALVDHELKQKITFYRTQASLFC